MIITDPLFYALAIPGVFVLGLSKGGFAGVGQMATSLLALVMPPLEAAAIMLPIMIAQDAASMWVYRHEWNGRVLAIMFPGAIVGIGIAWLVASSISDAMVRVFIGGTTILFCIYNLARMYRSAEDPPMEVRQASIVAGSFWGILSGFTSTICQAGGPPYQIYVLRLRLPKMVFVSTNAIFFGSLNWLKVIPFVALGQFSAKGLATSAMLLPLAMAANAFGFWAVRRTPERIFFQITMFLLFAISLALVWQGGKSLLP